MRLRVAPPRRRVNVCAVLVQHAPENAMDDGGEIARFHDRCSPLMRDLLGALAAAPGRPRPFPEIEGELGGPRRRSAPGPGAEGEGADCAGWISPAAGPTGASTSARRARAAGRCGWTAARPAPSGRPGGR